MKTIQKQMALLLTVLVLSATAAMAQPEGWDDAASEDTPIDGGLSLLIAAGAGYALSRKDKKKAGQ